MEEIATFIFRFVGCVLSGIIFGTFGYWFGWSFVKLIPLDNYPKNFWGKTREEIYIACIGMVGRYRHSGRGRPTLLVTVRSKPFASLAGLAKRSFCSPVNSIVK